MPRRVALQEWSIFKGSDCAVIAIVYHLLFHFEVKTRVVLDLLSRSSMPFPLPPCPGITYEDIWVHCAYPLSIVGSSKHWYSIGLPPTFRLAGVLAHFSLHLG